MQLRSQVGVLIRVGCVLSLLSTVACSVDPQRAAERYLESGDSYLAEEKLAEAIIEYRNAVRQDPLSFDARNKLGNLLAQVGDLGNATSQFASAADLRPQGPDAHIKAGSFLLVVGQPDEARSRAERALNMRPDHFRAQLLLAQAFAGLKDFDAAVSAAERAIELEPNLGSPYVALGSLQMQRGQRELALEALSRAVEVDDQSIASRLALARFHWVTGGLENAEVAFQAAVGLEPSDLRANQALAEFYAGTNRLREAEPYLEAVAQIAETPEAQLTLANFYARTGSVGLAVALLEPLSLNPMTAAQANVHLAAIDYEAGRTEDAHERLSIAVEGSTNVPALLLSAELLMREERYDEALSRATAAGEADPRHARPYVLIGQVRARQGEVASAIEAFEEALGLQPGDPFIARELSRLNLRAGHAERAVRFAQEAVAGRSSDVDAQLVLSGALLADGQYDRAAGVIEPLVTSHPRLVPARVQEGVLAASQGRSEAARTAFGLALELDPDNAAALNGLVRLDLAADDPGRARARANEWLESKPDHPASLLLAAGVNAAADDAETAERLLRRVLKVDPTNMSAYTQLGQLYWRQDRLDDARREFDALAERSPEPAGAVTMAGILLQAQGRTGEAQERFERALVLDPEAAVAANNLAWIYAEADENLDRALSLAQRATTALPNIAETNDTLDWVHYKKNLASLAVPFFEKSITLDSTNATYHYHLGLAAERGGDVARARQALERALELKTDFQGADDARSVLRSLPAAEPPG